MDMNEVVAHNIRQARVRRGMTQADLGSALEPLIGQRWSSSTVSVAEGAGGRQRQFDPNELVALALALGVPVPYLLLPIGPTDQIDLGGEPEYSTIPAAEVADYLTLQNETYTERLAGLGVETAPAIDPERITELEGQLETLSQMLGLLKSRRPGAKTKGGKHGKTS